MVLSGADLPLAAIRSQIASALDILIHLEDSEREKEECLRFWRFCPMKMGRFGLNKLYEFDMEEKVHKKVGELKKQTKIVRSRL